MNEVLFADDEQHLIGLFILRLSFVCCLTSTASRLHCNGHSQRMSNGYKMVTCADKKRIIRRLAFSKRIQNVLYNEGNCAGGLRKTEENILCVEKRMKFCIYPAEQLNAKTFIFSNKI